MMRHSMLLLILLWACAASAQSPEPNRPDWRAPSQAAGRENPLRNKPELAAGGRKLFMRNCDSCHGAQRTKAPDLSNAEVQRQADGELFWKITNGNARVGMPSWSSMPEAQRWQIILYLREMAKQKTNSEKK